MTDKTRFFPMAQTQKPTQFVPSAWVPMHTTYTPATLPGHGTVVTLQWQKDTEVIYAYERTMLPFAWTGKGFKAAAAPNMIPSTFAWDVGLSLMELMAVLELRKHKALTPYHPDAWESALQEVGLTQKYSHIIAGLHFSFDISFPTIITTQSPLNKESVMEFAGEFQKIKFRKGGVLAQSHGETLDFSSVHSSLHLFQSFQNQDK